MDLRDGKGLEDMTLEELWELFPVFLTAYDSRWKIWYEEEKEVLRRVFPSCAGARISHIGSTAIPGIWAKPIVDILAEIEKDCDIHELTGCIEGAGYLEMSTAKDRISFNKGYTPKGFAQKVFHLHLRYRGDNDELYFRDYLIANPDTAKAYENLKLTLWPQHKHNRDAYTNSKTSFIQQVTQTAKTQRPNQY